MDIGARISSDIDKYVNPKKNLKEQFDEHERILKGRTNQESTFLNTGSRIPKCKWCNVEVYLILSYCTSKINCCSNLLLVIKS
jgi:hypothetical protein